ncbi:MAG: argininosuccinate lyase [Mucinivorans sp.]
MSTKKLWQKDIASTGAVENFTVGADRELDMQLARADVLGSLSHTRMLQSIGLLSAQELQQVQQGLKEIYGEIVRGSFTIEDGVEDIHSQVELMLTDRLGEVGGKIHSGRSRNDQVLLDLRVYLRREIYDIVGLCHTLFQRLQSLANEHKDTLLPGYTHLQIAMPSSFGLWFGAYAESLVDDVQMLEAAYRIINKNPLGSAAGYGNSFPLNRTMTTSLLGFDTLSYNVVYAQMGRGKSERVLAQAMGSVASTLAKLAMDNALYLSQNFGFISYPPELTTGSSIMPHKKNPDVWEIMRGRCNVIAGVSNQITLLTTNLPSGYHRDLQLLKEVLFPAITSLKECLVMADYMLSHVSVKKDILEAQMYDYIFSVDVVNEMVLSGIPFREAYRTIGRQIEKGEYTPKRGVKHTHEGSIGNLCLDKVDKLMEENLAKFNFEKFLEAEKSLVQ